MSGLIHTTSDNLSECLDQIKTPYAILQYSICSTNTSKLYHKSDFALALKDFGTPKGSYAVSVLPYDVDENEDYGTVLHDAILKLKRYVLVWGPAHPYGEYITV
jgi:hypothetical protein